MCAVLFCALLLRPSAISASAIGNRPAMMPAYMPKTQAMERFWFRLS